MRRTLPLLTLFLLLPLLNGCGGSDAGVADMIYTDASFYTMDPDRPRAEAVAVKNGRFAAVGSRAEVDRWRGPGTRTVDLGGGFALPGLNDSHTHFDSAGRLLLGANLLAVSDAEGLREEIAAAAERMPEGAWITGGSWGAYESWEAGSTGEEKSGAGEKSELFRPAKGIIDPVSPENPVLVDRWDRSMYLANSLALEEAGITASTRAPRGITIHRDADGEPTGLFEVTGGSIMTLFGDAIDPPSHEQRLAEARLALEEVRRAGITIISDITGPRMLRIFKELKDNGELTVRVRPRPPLTTAEDFRAIGITTTVGDPWLRFTGLKGYVDGIMGSSGAQFFEPYEDDPTNYGHDRPMMRPEGNMERLVRETAAAGMVPHVHAIGTRGVDILLDIYEEVLGDMGLTDHRWRVIHAQVVRPEDRPRFGQMGLVAEINPYHLSDDMRWMAERIGERSRWAYAFRSLKDAGAVLVFGSDWPGTNAARYHQHPRYLIHAAVNRTTLEGAPEGGWFPEEKITVQEALEAFTINGAWANFEEEEFGSIETGKWADLTVLDQDLLEIDPQRIMDTEVLYTIIEGNVIWRNPDR
ncbi:MAG: amidohydrolase [bacterium]